MDQTAVPSDNPPPRTSQPDVTAQRERLREELLAAAEEESAAIVEAARQEITVTVRRARRDLRLIRAQLQLAGVEPRQLPMAELDPRHVARIASVASLEDETESPLSSEDLEGAALTEVTAAAPAVSRRLISPGVIVAFMAVLFVTGAVIGWRYVEPAAQSSPARASTHAGARATVQPQTITRATGDGDPPAVLSPAAAPATIRLQTIRPVWMRIDMDGAGDVGREYPAGVTRAFAPTRSLVIRAGDAGAVLLSMGQGQASPLGASGQVVTRRIAPGDTAETAAVAKPSVPAPAPASAPAAATPASVPALVEKSAAARDAADLPGPPVSTPAPATGQRPAVALPAPAVEGETQSAVFAGHVQWLDAYTRGDQPAIAALAADGYSVRDERTGRTANASRTTTPLQVADVHIDLAGIGAVLTARLRSSVDGVPNESLLSEVWVRGAQQRWSLLGVRITPMEKVSLPGR